MTTKLKLFREALRELGQATVTATDDGVVGSQSLSEAYDDAIAYCLEQGYWNFALRTTTLATGGIRQFGYAHASPKPTDWLRTVRVSTDSSFWPPLENYEDSIGFIHHTDTPVYMAYVSNHATAGLNLSHWTSNFASFVACELAARVCARIGGSQDDYDRVAERAKQYLINALLKDSIDGGSLARQEDFAVATPARQSDRS